MPTISQLPAVSQVTAADLLPISQGGSACSVSIGALLASTQPAILATTGTLLGRTSLGPGGPDPVEIGTGLLLNAETLLATGADHATFLLQNTLTLTDEVVVSSGGNSRLLPLPLLRGLFSPGSNISIDQYGTISAGSSAGALAGATEYSVSTLPAVTAISASDLVAISQSGVDHTITYANLIDGQTIDQAQAAAAASDSDSFPSAQAGNVMFRQTMSAVWTWINSKLPNYQLPTVELTATTTLTAAAHNARLLICSQPITIVPAPINMGTGFNCDLINASTGNVTLGSGITTSSGNSSLPPGQAASLICATFSGGTLVYAWTSGSIQQSDVPGQVSDLTASAGDPGTIILNWGPESLPVTSYTVQFRLAGSSGWSTASIVTTPGYTVTGLLSATSYDFVVSAANGAGAGMPSAIVTMTTSVTADLPGAVIGLTTSNATAGSMSLTWSSPVSGGPVSSYTVQYRASGTTAWTNGGLGLTSTAATVIGLLPATNYDFEVFGINSAGTGPVSGVVTAATTAGNSVTSITWNMTPSGSYAHGVGAIGINAHISPSGASVQFGFSMSTTVSPTSWTVGSYVNTDLWGAYVNTPSVSGTWYCWAEGTDGRMPTVYPTGFSVT